MKKREIVLNIQDGKILMRPRELKDFEKRTLSYARKAGIEGFKNGRQVLDAIHAFAQDPKNREAIKEIFKE